MGFFDRFTSKKGKDQTAGPKRGVVSAKGGSLLTGQAGASGGKGKIADDKKVFAAVPSGKEEKVAKDDVATEKVGKGKVDKSKVAPTKVSSKTSHLAHAILVRPIVTEKSTRGGTRSQYTFEVHTTASKMDVRRAVQHLYGVTPVAVNVSTMRGKIVRFGRTQGRTMKRKKAVVTLPTGKTIDVVSA